MGEEFPTSTNESEDQSSVFQFVMMFVLMAISVGTVFVAFLIWGAVSGNFLNGFTARAIASGAMALLFPMLAGLSMMGRDVDNMALRLSRMFTSVAIVSIGGAALCGIFLAPMVLDGLEKDPNWYLSKDHQNGRNGIYKISKDASQVIANVVEDIATTVGTYDRRG